MNIEKYDEIHIENLVCFARHGVYPEETALGQKFVVSLTMYTKTRRAGMSDELEASTNYGGGKPVYHGVDEGAHA